MLWYCEHLENILRVRVAVEILQLDVRNLSLGRRHQVNEVNAGIGVIAGKTVIMPERLECKVPRYYKKCAI